MSGVGQKVTNQVERRRVGYCTNVHPGVSLEQIKQNLECETLEVKRLVSPDQPFGVGLWLSQTATRELASAGAQAEFRDWLAERGLVPFTINAFPFGDFHQPVVKHAVYRPTWLDAARLEYTQDVASIVEAILPAGVDATISTLPMGWPAEADGTEKMSDADFRRCADNLIQLTQHLDTIAQTGGREIRVCLEPEPGCVIDRWQDVVAFFARYLRTGSATETARVNQYFGVCHDICHSAVMFEPQTEALDAYRQHDIAIGKVQVSAAIEIDFDSLGDADSSAVLEQLRQFAEPKYLHQTTVSHNGYVRFYEDLPLAIAQREKGPFAGKWRVHFHVPIDAGSLGRIASTQSQIVQALDWFARHAESCQHFEVETYAWNVLPDSHQPARLTDGIAAELNWLLKRLH